MNFLKELSSVQMKMVKILSKDIILCKLLKFTDEDPLSKELDKNDDVFMKNITVIPKVNYENLKEGKVVVNLPYASVDGVNDESTNLIFMVDVFTTLDTWVTIEDKLRPIMIMERIGNALHRKRLSSVGLILFKTFELEVVSDEVSCYHMRFEIDING